MEFWFFGFVSDFRNTPGNRHPPAAELSDFEFQISALGGFGFVCVSSLWNQCSRWRLGESLARPENVIALIVTCGFLVNVQQGTDTNAILRDDPLVFKGIRVLTILLGGSLAIATVLRRRIPYGVCLSGVMLPLTLYFCCCLLSVPFSAYPLLSLFKACEIGLVVLRVPHRDHLRRGGALGFLPPEREDRAAVQRHHLDREHSVSRPGLGAAAGRDAAVRPCPQRRLSRHQRQYRGALRGRVVSGLSAPRAGTPGAAGPGTLLPALLGLASVVCSYSRISLLGLAVAAMGSLLLLRKYALGWAIVLCLLLLGTSPKARTLVVEHLARGQEDRSLDTFSSHRLTMWDHVLSDYRVSVVGRGYAAGFRYDEDLDTGHAHNSVVELYFNVGLLGVVAWLLFIVAVCSRLYRLLRSRAAMDGQLVSIVGVMVFMLMKALASTVFVYLDASMLIMVGIVIYVVRRLAARRAGGVADQRRARSSRYPTELADMDRLGEERESQGRCRREGQTVEPAARVGASRLLLSRSHAADRPGGFRDRADGDPGLADRPGRRDPAVQRLALVRQPVRRPHPQLGAQRQLVGGHVVRVPAPAQPWGSGDLRLSQSHGGAGSSGSIDFRRDDLRQRVPGTVARAQRFGPAPAPAAGCVERRGRRPGPDRGNDGSPCGPASRWTSTWRTISRSCRRCGTDEPPVFLKKDDPRLDLAYPEGKETRIETLRRGRPTTVSQGERRSACHCFWWSRKILPRRCTAAEGRPSWRRSCGRLADRLAIVGMTSGRHAIGQWTYADIYGRRCLFLPVIHRARVEQTVLISGNVCGLPWRWPSTERR